MDKIIAFTRFLTSARPDPDFQYTKLTLVVAGVLILVAIAIMALRKKFVKDEILRKLLKRYPMPLALFSMALLCLLFFRELGFPIFSMRLWWVALGLMFAYWSVKELVLFPKNYKERKEKFGARQAKSKYLPKKKR
jgi:amino acid transporter